MSLIEIMFAIIAGGYGAFLVWIYMSIRILEKNQVDMVNDVQILVGNVNRLEAEEAKFQTASEVFMSESADWATGIDTFREEMLKSHPKIRGILDAKGKADKAEQVVNERKG